MRRGRLASVVALCLGLLASALPEVLAAQENGRPPAEVAIDGLATRVQVIVANAATPTASLEAVREELVRARNTAQAVEAARAPAVAELRGRLDALGAPPAEGESEAPEVARLRQQLNEELAAAQAPVLVAQEAVRRANALIAEVDRVIRSRIAAERYGHGPLPVLPGTWAAAIRELDREFGGAVAEWRLGQRVAQDTPEVMRHLPGAVLLALVGLAITFLLRRRIGDWIELRLAQAETPRVSGRLLILRSLNRILLPTLGLALVVAAIDVAVFGGRPTPAETVTLLPSWVLSLIVAGWLGSSFFAPRAPAYRVAPLETEEARAASRLTLLGGAVLAVHFAFADLIRIWLLSPETQAIFGFVVVLAGSAVLWRAARVVDRIAGTLVVNLPGAAANEETGGRIGWWLLRQLARALRLIAVLAPPVAAVGYVAGAAFFVVGALLTLALISAGVVVQDLVSRALTALLANEAEPGDGGLIPVVVGLTVIVGALPLIALIWGARTADISDAWSLLTDGVTVGGMTISLNVVLRFLVAFATIALATRLIQSLLVGSVFPRTKLDVGAREAARAGVGYAGFALAVVAGIGAAGLNLSNLALVAGALSVGIGFGLQAVVSNFVSGIILLVERPIKPGDWIEVGGYAGYVRGIRVRSTEIETFDRASVIIPNSQLISGTVLNRTHTGMSGRLQVTVSVTYGTDPREVERILLDIASAHPLLLEQPAPTVLLTNLGPDSMDFELRGWLRDVNYSLSVRSDLNFEILTAFAKRGIRMQFYGRDLRPAAPAEAGEDA